MGVKIFLPCSTNYKQEVSLVQSVTKNHIYIMVTVPDNCFINIMLLWYNPTQMLYKYSSIIDNKVHDNCNFFSVIVFLATTHIITVGWQIFSILHLMLTL